MTDQPPPDTSQRVERSEQLFREHQLSIYRRTDRLFANLMILQWFAGIAAALWISPKTWAGIQSQTHVHVWAAIALGGLITSFPVFLATTRPGWVGTRYAIAIGQMLTSALLIHLTGGRIETHFHVFGSLAFLAFYRDWRVLVPATVVVAADHFARGLLWPQSVFGVLVASPWRWVEHAGWVIFEDIFLFMSIHQSVLEMKLIAERQSKLETHNQYIEERVAERTRELLEENAERKRAEEKLRDSEALYHSLVEELPINIYRKDRDGRFTFANTRFCQFKGLTKEQIIGRTSFDISARHLAEQFATEDLRILETGKSLEQEEVRHDLGETTRFFHVVKSPVVSSNGNIIGMQGMFFEITDRKAAEAELAYERDLLRTLLKESPDQIYFKDRESRFLKCSNTLAAKFGMDSVDGLVGRSDFDFFSEEHARPAFEDEQEIIRTGKPMIGKVEKECPKSNGKPTWVLTTKVPLRNKEGEIIGTFGISKDLTKIKEAEAKLEEVHKQLLQAARMTGMAEVATGVLHNVGNVLNSVNVSATLVADRLRTSQVANLGRVAALLREHEAHLDSFLSQDPKGRKIPACLMQLSEHLAGEEATVIKELELLRQNIEHIKDIVVMQQSYAKVSGITETVPVTELVEDALRMNTRALTRHQVELIREYEANLPDITVEKHKVLQILVNLIRNAKYACDESGRADKRLTIKLTNGNERVRIAVIDNGIGIPSENIDRIFNHGFTTRKDGHGFGLHSGALAAKELSGSLSAHSDGPGRGASFVLELPCLPDPSLS